MDTENKKTTEDVIIDEKKDVEKTELLIALPALIDNIRNDLKLSEEQLFVLNSELNISILEDQKTEIFVEKIEDLFLGNLDESLIEKIIEKILVFFDSKDIILASENQPETKKIEKEIAVSEPTQKVINVPKENVTMLNKLSQSFTAPTTITPTKRVYTDLPGAIPSSAAPSQETKVPPIDPYRIDPNEK